MTKGKKTNGVVSLIIVSVIIIILCIIYGLLTYGLKDRGTFGDMFGALTALFSGLAFAGIIYTILLQREELSLQRRELRLTRKEFKQQNATLKKQRFETTLFNLINRHAEAIAISFYDLGPTGSRGEGEHAFSAAYNFISSSSVTSFHHYKKNNQILEKVRLEDLDQTQSENYLTYLTHSLFNDFANNFSLYAQSLYQLMKFIEKSKLLDSQEERLYYADILKDQMTYHQKAVLMYYCLLPANEVKVVGSYLLKYKMLDDLKAENFITRFDKMIFEKWGHNYSSGLQAN